MTRYVALLRAVNVGGTGKLPMEDLRALCEAAGFAGVRTYIASGNVVFDSDADEAAVKATLERALFDLAGKAVGAVVRTGAEMAGVVAANPFKHERPEPRRRRLPRRTARPLIGGTGSKACNPRNSRPGTREIFIHYPDGQADTKLRIPALAAGTARNLNTVAKLAEMAGLIE